MKLSFWETRMWESVYPQVIGGLSVLFACWLSYRGYPILENMRDTNIATMFLGTIAAGFLLMSTILLAQKNKTFPVLKDMKLTGEYSVFMAYVSDAVRSTFLLVFICFFALPTASDWFIYLYVYMAVRSFLMFFRAISILLMILKSCKKT